MESSFKKGYDKTVNADGSFNLILNGKRSGAAQTSGLFITYGLVFLLLFFIGFNVLDRLTKSLPTFLFLWGAFTFGGLFLYHLILQAIFSKSTNMVVKPLEGLVFEGKQLPFKDIQFIGTNHQTTNTNLEGNAQVFANSHGTKVVLTGWIPVATADAIAEEIKEASGITWK